MQRFSPCNEKFDKKDENENRKIILIFIISMLHWSVSRQFRHKCEGNRDENDESESAKIRYFIFLSGTFVKFGKFVKGNRAKLAH